jgi:two-component system, LuxR family, sensor histidine kinase DctS
MKTRFSIHEGILIAFLAGIALLMWLLLKHETELHRNDLIRDMSVAEAQVTSQLETDQLFVEQLARERSEGALTREQFETRVSQRAVESPHILAMLLTDNAQNIRWSAPANRSQIELRRNRAPFSEIERVTRLTVTTSRPSYSEPFVAPDSKAYVEYIVPVASGGVNAGFITAIISVSAFNKTLLPDWFLKKYDVNITDRDGVALAGRRAGADEKANYLEEQRTFALPWRGLQMHVRSQPRGSALAAVTIASTILLLTGMIGWSFYSLRRESVRRSESERSARAANERFETVLDSLNVGVYVSDEKTGELLYNNENFRQMFPGVQTGNVAPLEDAFEPNPSTLFNTNADDLTSVNKSEIRHKPSNRWFITRVRRLRWVDGRAARLHTMGDVTDRVDAERVNRAQQERLMLTSRLMTAGEMASTLAHEINQPLAAITNYLRGCVQRLRSGDAPISALTPAIEKASAQAERAGSIINRVREFVRTRDPQRSPIPVQSLIDDVMRFAEPDPTKPVLSFHTDIEPGLPPVLADRIMIEQVLLNLVRNAREAMATIMS